MKAPMLHRAALWLGMALFSSLATSPGQAGERLTGIYVAAREFVVTVSPVDEESKNAENSDLYQRTSESGEWINLGGCKKIVMPNGEVRFLKVVEVDRDGLFHYTSRPVVGGVVSSPPDRNSPPQASVMVDTLAPIVTITSPAELAEPTAGDNIDIAWEAKDENLAERPVTLAWSTDGGVAWNPLAENMTAKGDMVWRIPEEVVGPAVIQAFAFDRAGNRGEALRQLEVAALKVETPVQPPVVAEKEIEKAPEEEESKVCPEDEERSDRNRSWLYYLMAVNLMRQDKPKDALQYYWLAVKADPEFIDAWADIVLAYIDVGAYRTAREIAEQTRDKDPNRIDLMHLMGETYHAEGMALLGRAQTTVDRTNAQTLIDTAVDWYGLALETAADEWRLAEQAASFYRLGEICYYVNLDAEGARAYWMKILDLHSPTPNPDLVLWTPEKERAHARRRYEKDISRRVSLEAWQNWARGYVLQLDERRRKGITDLMPANQINRHNPQPTGSVASMPGRADGRSLFSLPTQYGSPDPAPAASGTAPNNYSRQTPPAAEYSFYAVKRGQKDAGRTPPRTPPPRGNRSVFSGGPDLPVPQTPDPYSFPQSNRPKADWMSAGPYGNSPVGDW